MAIQKDEGLNYLPQQELKRLFNAIEKHGSNRDNVIFQISYVLGLRAGEVGLIRVRDYNPISKEIYIRSLKSSVKRALRLDDKRARLLNKYIQETGLKEPDAYLFPSMTRTNKGIGNKALDALMKKYSSLAKITKHHFHILRHSIGVHLAEAGADLKEIQFMLRHKNIQNTLIYFTFTSVQMNSFYHKVYANPQLIA